MKVDALNCPACGAAIKESITPYKQVKCPACGSMLALTDSGPHKIVMCLQCDTLNDPVTRYCNKCGAALQIDCPYCYQANPVGAIYCEGCGANLQKAVQRRTAWLAEKQKHDEERRATMQQVETQTRVVELNRLLDSLDEPNEHAFAIYCLRQYGAYAVEPLLMVLKNDADPDARFGAAHTLDLIGDDRAIPALIEALSDPEPAVRYWSLVALGDMHAERAVGAISRLLKDRHRGVKESAAAALKRIGTPQALKDLDQK